MAATIRSSATGVATAGAATFTVAKPAGLAVADLLIALQQQSADTAMPALVAGFVHEGGLPGVSASGIPACRISAKRATSDDVAATSFAFPNEPTSAAEANTILVAVEAGTYDPAIPLELWPYNAQAVSGNLQHVMLSVDADADDRLLAVFAMDCSASDHTYPASGGNAPTGMSQVAWVQDNVNYTLQGVYTEVRTTAGATGTRTVTPGGATSLTNKGWTAVGLLVRPAPTGTAPEGPGNSDASAAMGVF